jgi:predicted permease
MNFLPENLEDLRNVRIEPMVLAFTCIVTLGTGLLFGSAPILQTRSLRLSSVLNQANRTGTAGSRRSALRQALVGFEVALALVLFLGAGLLLNSLIRLQSADPGFDASNLVTIRLPLSQPAYADSATRQTLLADVVDRVSQLPGVVSVATGSGVAPRMDMMVGGPVLEGEDPADVASAPPSSIALVAPDYFAALRMRFVEGRGFTEADMLGGSSPMVINESYARTRWPDVSAVGQRFKLGRGKSWFHVVGVVQDVASEGLGTSRERAQFYFTSHLFGPIGGTSLIVRTTDDPLAMIPQLKQQIWVVDARLPLGDIGLVERMLSRSIARQRFSALVLSGFAFLALTLAAIGVYGVISLAVNQRTREIGVRVALGAQSADITKMVVSYGMKPIVWGILLGIAGSLAASRVLRSLLFEVQQTDVPTYVVVTLLLAMVGFTAAYLPSRRAATIDPLEALREE